MNFELVNLLRLAFGQYKKQILLMGILSSVGGILEGIGINAVIPLFAFVSRSPTETADFISGAIKNFFLYFNLGYSVGYLLVFIAILFFFKALFLFISQYLAIKIRADYENKTRSELLKLTLESDWPYLSRQKIGYLNHILVTDVHMAATAITNISGFILTSVNLVIYTLLAINISFLVAALSMAFGVLAYFIFKPWFGKIREAVSEGVKTQKEVAHYINEDIIGMKTIKSVFVEVPVFKKGSDYFDYLKKLRIKYDVLQGISSASLQLIGVFFILFIFVFFYKTAGFSLAAFTVIVYAVNRVFAGIQALQAGIYSLNSYAPHLTSVLQYKKETKRHQEETGGIKEFNFNNKLEFQNVSFAYDEEKTILDDTSFFFKKGELVGLIGPSGAGKTTIVDLLLRFFKPQTGRILLDGDDISNISLEEWRTNVGYVSQDIFLINDTIFNNIKFYNDSLTSEDIIQAAKMANIHEFIESLPGQFETVVGERGVRLSGGQRQRIVLARILARKPKILILDEATSALDNESEIAVQKAIDGLRGKITVFAIAHRLSTVINSDRLIVLEQGRVVEVGAPRELLKDKESYFSKVYNLRR